MEITNSLLVKDYGHNSLQSGHIAFSNDEKKLRAAGMTGW